MPPIDRLDRTSKNEKKEVQERWATVGIGRLPNLYTAMGELRERYTTIRGEERMIEG